MIDFLKDKSNNGPVKYMIKDIITYRRECDSMQRDMSLVREVLLRVESLEIPAGRKIVCSGCEPAFQIEGYTVEQVDVHLALLADAGFISGKTTQDGVITGGLTWRGCEFVDTVREPEVWRRTKDAAAKIGGGSIEILVKIATATALAFAKEKLLGLGLDLG